MASVSRLYERIDNAERAAEALAAAGYNRADIGIFAPHSNVGMGLDSMDDIAKADDSGAMARAAVAGAILGGLGAGAVGLLMGLGILVIPGVGPAENAGPIASAFIFFVVGLLAGGMIGALSAAGLPPLDSNEYSLNPGNAEALLYVYTEPEKTAEATSILDETGAAPFRRPARRRRARVY